MKLELKHLVPYLPYKLKCEVQTESKNTQISEMHSVYSDGTCTFHDLIESEQGFKNIKPILKPLRDLHQLKNDLIEVSVVYDDIEISSCGRGIIFKGKGMLSDFYNTNELPYNFIQILFKNSFDVFDLIKNGLAIDINSL